MRHLYEKFSTFDLYKKLVDLHWRGKYYSLDNETTYLSEDNKTLAIVTYDNKKSLILSTEFKK